MLAPGVVPCFSLLGLPRVASKINRTVVDGPRLMKTERWRCAASKARTSSVSVPLPPPSPRPWWLPVLRGCQTRVHAQCPTLYQAMPPEKDQQPAHSLSSGYCPGCPLGRITPLVPTEGQRASGTQTHSPGMRDCTTWQGREACCPPKFQLIKLKRNGN